MSEFEKWFNQKYPLTSPLERGPTGKYLKKECEAAWKQSRKVALEWAIKNLEQYTDEWNLSDLDDIKKELEQLKNE